MLDGVDPPTMQALRDHLGAAGLARQKWPEAIYQVDELPRTPSGKVQKFRLREQLRDGRLVTTSTTEGGPRSDDEPDHPPENPPENPQE